MSTVGPVVPLFDIIIVCCLAVAVGALIAIPSALLIGLAMVARAQRKAVRADLWAEAEDAAALATVLREERQRVGGEDEMSADEVDAVWRDSLPEIAEQDLQVYPASRWRSGPGKKLSTTEGPGNGVAP